VGDQASALWRERPIFLASATMAGMAAARSEGGPTRVVSSQKERTETDGKLEEIDWRTPEYARPNTMPPIGQPWWLPSWLWIMSATSLLPPLS
jgi:hypothetical protein